MKQTKKIKKNWFSRIRNNERGKNKPRMAN